MKAIKYTVWTIRNMYKKALDKFNGIEDRIEYAIYRIDELILKLGDARTACVKANVDGKLSDRITKLENRIKDLYAKKQEMRKNKADIVARVAQLEAEREAAIACSKCSTDDGIDFGFDEINQYIKQLEAELDTATFMESL